MRTGDTWTVPEQESEDTTPEDIFDILKDCEVPPEVAYDAIGRAAVNLEHTFEWAGTAITITIE